jgi:hypothetical protein
MKVKVNVLIDKVGWLEIVPKQYALDSDLAVQLGGRLLEIDSVKRVEFTNINHLETTKEAGK